MVKQQNGYMKTTVDLPNDLLRDVKLRAAREGRKLKDEMAALLRKGLAASQAPPVAGLPARSPRIGTDPRTGLPVIVCAADAPARRMTAEQLIALGAPST